MADIQIKTVTGGPLDVNTYVVGLEGRDSCVVVDPGAEPERILHTRSLPEVRAAEHIVAYLTGNSEWDLPMNHVDERR